ncbi:NUDIX hydrolase domain-like protein [Melampsora americana]|nr:NUDIX hydrolase domain-like protein [Melampsora americana]
MTKVEDNSFLKVIERCNNFRLPSSIDFENDKEDEGEEKLIPFYIWLPDSIRNASIIKPNLKSLKTSNDQTHEEAQSKDHKRKVHEDLKLDSPIGFLRPCVVKAMIKDNQEMLKIRNQTSWKVLYLNQDRFRSSPDDLEDLPCCIGFEDWINFGEEDPMKIRSKEMERLIKSWKQSNQFISLLAGWRDEKYTIYAPQSYMKDSQLNPKISRIALQLERSGCQLFSFLTFGAHLTAYVIKEDQYHFWIPRRSPTKQTYPSMLDNTVGGGITSGESARQTIIRECFEEASLPEEIVLKGLKSTGLISYVHKNSDGWVSPEVQYIYDLELSSNVIPKSNDGESIDYTLMSFDQIKLSLLKFTHQWKPNCGIVLIDFFIRHGLIDDENEMNFLQISLKLKEHIPLPVP